MKVLLVNDSLTHTGGTEAIVQETAQYLAQAGMMPVVACGRHDPKFTQGLQVNEMPELLGSAHKAAPAVLETLVERERPDIIHMFKVPNPSFIRYAAARLPTVVTVCDHAMYCPGGSRVFWRTGAVCTRTVGLPCILHSYVHGCAARNPLRLWRQLAFSRGAVKALRRVDRVLALSAYVRDQLIDSGLESNRVKVLPPWVNLPAQNRIRTDETILFVGRITREKGLPALLRSLSLLEGPFQGVIVGDGPLRAYCEKLASELGIEAFVQFRGWLGMGEVRKEYARCALVVVPSLWPEPFGMVGPEAMAFGKPVVAFDVGGVRDWMDDNVDGVLVPPGDHVRLAVAISDLLRNVDRRAELGEAAREHVVARFSRERLASELLANYREILAGYDSFGEAKAKDRR